jgi:ubiquinol-cytochrome c reductase cytochrome c subunit
VLAAVAVLFTVAGWTSMAAAQDATDERHGERSEIVRGGEIFQAACAACHGTRLEGGPGPGVLEGPAMTDTDIAYVDLTMRTGRMPIVAREVGIYVDELDDEQREAVNAYLLAEFDLPGQIPTVGEGDAGRGQELYIRNCAACHGAAGDGGIAGAGNIAWPLTGLDAVAIASATRVGPFTMPAFDVAVLDDQQLADIVAYLELAAEVERTFVGVAEIDQVGEALFAIGLALLAALAVWVVARARRWSPAEPDSFARTEPFEPR